MQAIPSQVETTGTWSAIVGWVGHNAVLLALIPFAFLLGMGVNNGEATKTAVASVQTTYQGKVDYHVQHEKALVKTTKTAISACNHNLDVAADNAAAPQDLKPCPPTVVVAK